MPNALTTDTFESLITSTTAATIAGVTVQAIANWRDRGYRWRNPETGREERLHLTVAARDPHGRPLYRWLDVAKAEAATRHRARRTWTAA